ncbi:MAG TPA: hypothetical protein VL752_13795 [Acidisoma sp.]|uniref:hypothetical protein n=1 Tax=Acidisoma sp. TaxID=1872115 RepID=UPI002C26DF21|nr:hypothetical protein [Acidisoma sp.]HTI02015.1 hypothetical protein [Acidisoma sp.]
MLKPLLFALDSSNTAKRLPDLNRETPPNKPPITRINLTMTANGVVSQGDRFSDQANTGYLAIPCPPDKLGEFIAGLLGKPKAIQKKIAGAICITRDDIANFHHLIEQRIHEQNVAQLIKLTIEIQYDDNSTVCVSSIKEFLTYSELRPIVSKFIAMNWVYLVQFNNKEAPERQEISLEISTNNSSISNNFDRYQYDVSDDIQGYIKNRSKQDFTIETGKIEITIAHTSRSWAVDIENLLTNQAQSYIRDESWLRKFLVDFNFPCHAVLFLSLSTFLIWLGYRGLRYNYHVNYETILAKPILNNLTQSKIDFISSYLTSGSLLLWILLSTVYVFLTFAIAGVAAGATISLANIPEPSFLLLSKNSEKYKLDIERHCQANLKVFSAGVILNVILGLVSSYLFAFFN